jgi:hypothetical protein
MKKIVYFNLFIGSLLLMSCAEANKDDSDSLNPNLDKRDNFVGYWTANEKSALAGTNSHTVNIIKSTTNSTEVLLNNFSGLSVSARASVNNNFLTIPFQQIGQIGFTQGSGTLTSATSISLNYTTTAGTSRDSCTAIYTKQ